MESPEQPTMEAPTEVKAEEPKVEPMAEPKVEEPKKEEPAPEAAKTEAPAATEGEGKPAEVTAEAPQAAEDAEKKRVERQSMKKKKEPVEYHSICSGFVEKKGKLFGFQHNWMTLDDDGKTIRWYKSDDRKTLDCTGHMDQCNAVSEPSEHYHIKWPENSSDRTFVIDTRSRVFFVVAESTEKKSEWIQKLKDAKEKYTPKEPEPAATPAASEGMPAATEGMPAATEGMPAASEGTPAASEGTPAASEGTPAASEGTPAATTEGMTTEPTKQEEAAAMQPATESSAGEGMKEESEAAKTE